MRPPDHATGAPDALRQHYAGAPESLRRAARLLADDPALPRLTRRAWRRLADSLPPPPAPRPGVVLFPAVRPDGVDGCLYRVTAGPHPPPGVSRVPRDLATHARDLVQAALPSLPVGGLTLTLSGPPPGTRWRGDSVGLALAVALVSFALERPVPRGQVLTGALGEAGTGEIVPVRHLDAKRALVGLDLRASARLIHPVGPTPLVDLLDTLWGPGWRDGLDRARARQHLARARRARQRLDDFRWAEALELAQAVLDEAPDDEAALAEAAWVHGAAALHRGQAEAGLASLHRALEALPRWEEHPDEPPDDLTAEELHAHVLVALVDTGQHDTAWTRGHALLDTLDGLRRTRRWRLATLSVAGSTHRAGVALDRHAEAAALLERWSLGDAALATERARAHGDLAEVLRKQGDLDGAAHHLDQAQAHLPRTAPHARETTRHFLALYAARLAADRGTPSDPPPPPEGLWPALGRRLLTDPPDALAAHLTDPVIASSLPLQWVVCAEIGRRHLAGRPAPVEAARSTLAGWRLPGGPWGPAQAPHTSEDWAAVVRRCPY